MYCWVVILREENVSYFLEYVLRYNSIFPLSPDSYPTRAA